MRELSAAALMLGIPAAVLFLGVFASPVPAAPANTVRAPFEVRGASGNTLMYVGERAEGGYLSIFNAHGDPVASMISAGHAGTVGIVSPGQGAVQIGIGSHSGIGYVAITGKDQLDLATLGVNADDKAMALSIYNAAKKRIAWFGESRDDGSGAFALADPNGVWRLEGGVGGPHGVPAGIGVVRAYGPNGSYPGECGVLTGH
ncbi:MAG TPA: hypothetical protein VKW09_10890 [bacterium]|nr:hypothetical protein [bacterium]